MPLRTFLMIALAMVLAFVIWQFTVLPAPTEVRESRADTALSSPSSTHPTQPRPRSSETLIPSDVSFSIINSTTVLGVKRSLDVRLNKRVSEQTLRALARGLKAQDSRAYDRTFIVYYLPGMVVGAGGWATTHFNPQLRVEILGLTADEEQRLAARPEPSSRDIVGRWLDEAPLVGGRITIFVEGKGLYLEQAYKDGSAGKQGLVEKMTPLGRRFDNVEGSSHGDHWVLGSDGNLQLRDNEGLIRTARKIR